MDRVAAMLLLAPLLAGCLGGDEPETTGAREAFEVADAAARQRFEYTLFLGITGTEGPLDWGRYEAALNTTAGPGPSLARAFDQDSPYGEMGDGRLGSWLATHFAYDEEERLVGGLYTQVLADGSRRAALAQFSGPYAGTTALPGMLHAQDVRGAATQGSLPVLDALGRFQAEAGARAADESVLCALQTHTDGWGLSSADAAAVALADAEFRRHVEALPGGELTYYYFPGLAVDEDCPVELDVPDNFWSVSYTDLDAFLDPTTPSPPLYSLRIDAADGSIGERSLSPLVLRPPTLVSHTLTATDPAVPTTDHHSRTLTIPVDAHASDLRLQVHRTDRAPQTLDDSTRLRDPLGRIIDRTDFQSALHRYEVADPEPGDWVLEYRYRSLTPNGEHALEVHGAVTYR